MTAPVAAATTPAPASRNDSAASRGLTAGQAVVAGLRERGVDTVFGIPGVQTYELFDALRTTPGIEVIGTRHEQACAYMALGYAQSTGRPGVYSVVPGPGVLNAGAGMLTSLATSTPTVCLTSEIPTEFIGRGMGHLHEMPDQQATVSSFSKWATTVTDPAEVPAAMAEAFGQATGGRPGPAVVAVPWDVLTQKALMEPVAAPAAPAAGAEAEDVARAAEFLVSARNPMIMVGSGARHAGDGIRALAEKLQAPVVSLRGGRGIVSDEHPLGFTSAEGFERWADTDVLLGIGTRQELVWFRWPDAPEGLRTVNVDVDPAQQDRLVPDVALTGDARLVTAQLLEALHNVPARPSRTAELAAVKAATRAEVAELQPHSSYLDAIRETLPRDGYFVEEVSQIGFASIFALEIYEPRHFITSGYQGNLGYGFQTALGVQAAHRDSVVVSVTGDGGFMYGVQELATAVQYGLNVITVVFDNHAFGNVQADQVRIYGHGSATELANPDFVALAESFGALGLRATTPDELRAAMAEAVAARRPTVIEVPMPLSLEQSPWKFLMPASRAKAAQPERP
ncbi:thiamine pyrophosphate-dependent enzyme [Kocuria tytonis]|uniref:Thiamine pyrophosphate-binding protein n=1 Tax=Kocuria tytonis TaxID=2054280 RepID=A0A495A2K3_9MICC|nr:thiamine pyrophosphate-dependent enzyme [Kocuria tytonis]RKQ33747.1 hypothetical protein C1C97_011130 [Kocuria tytonis]